MNATMALQRSHRSIRKFKATPVSIDLVKTIIETAQCAATSSHVQAYTVIQVTDKVVRRRIAELSGPQAWVEQAPVFLVFCADLNRLEKACSLHGKKMAQGFAEQFVVATVDTALLAQNALIAAESLGLGGVYIGGIRNDPQKVCDLLEITGKAYPVFGMCLGYPGHNPPVKPRLPVEAVFKIDRYDRDNEDAFLRAFDRVTNTYYRNRDINLKDQTWTGQIAEFMSRKVRPHMKSFFQKRDFFIR
ncbi:MAG: oxygen-insensitive NADPH nitroreductase [Deltaproteobacteria bacterium]|nr:oxygen-insensitive NADPH nitroreductase [Deltaproteobacteria bacterium]